MECHKYTLLIINEYRVPGSVLFSAREQHAVYIFFNGNIILLFYAFF